MGPSHEEDRRQPRPYHPSQRELAERNPFLKAREILLKMGYELEKINQILVEFSTNGVIKFEEERPPRTVCKNAFVMAKQVMIDLNMAEGDIDHILVWILGRGIQFHYPIDPE